MAYLDAGLLLLNNDRESVRWNEDSVTWWLHIQLWGQHINVCLKEVLIQTDVGQDASLPNKLHLKGKESGGKAQEASGNEGRGLHKVSRSKKFQPQHPFARSLARYL